MHLVCECTSFESSRYVLRRRLLCHRSQKSFLTPSCVQFLKYDAIQMLVEDDMWRTFRHFADSFWYTWLEHAPKDLLEKLCEVSAPHSAVEPISDGLPADSWPTHTLLLLPCFPSWSSHPNHTYLQIAFQVASNCTFLHLKRSDVCCSII